VGELAHSFNGMSLQLRAANEEIVDLGQRRSKIASSRRRRNSSAPTIMCCTWKRWPPSARWRPWWRTRSTIRSPGFLPTPSCCESGSGRANRTRKREEAMQCLDLIATESRRCGDLIKNLLSFSRTAPMNVQSTDLNAVIDRCLLLVRHQLDLAGIELQLELAKICRACLRSGADRTGAARLDHECHRCHAAGRQSLDRDRLSRRDP
jgi:signal transduction histidine kinase